MYFVLSMCIAICFGHIFLYACVFVFLMTLLAYSFFLQLYSSLLPFPSLLLPSSLSSSILFSSLDQVSSRLAGILLIEEDHIYDLVILTLTSLCSTEEGAKGLPTMQRLFPPLCLNYILLPRNMACTQDSPLSFLPCSSV